MNNGKRSTGKVIAWIIGIILIISALLKFFQVEPVVQMFEAWNLREYMALIGLLELIIGVLLVIPQTMPIASFLVSAFLGGAVATHVIHDQIDLAVIPVIFLIFVWIAAALQ